MERSDSLLEVLISTFGSDGLRRVAAHSHPAMGRVRYTVCVQTGSGRKPEIPDTLKRDDFCIHFIIGKGLSVNRNHLLSIASAPFILIGDDDVDYSEEQLSGLIEKLDSHPYISIFTFRYLSEFSTKRYPPEEFDLSSPPRGYYPSSIEIACRLDDVRAGNLRFDTDFGLGARYIAGEEELFVHAALRLGLRGRYFPIPVCRHDSISTGERCLTPALIRAKSAVIRRMHPRTWLLRMIAHAIRNSRERSGISCLEYVRAWLSIVGPADPDDA